MCIKILSNITKIISYITLIKQSLFTEILAIDSLYIYMAFYWSKTNFCSNDIIAGCVWWRDILGPVITAADCACFLFWLCHPVFADTHLLFTHIYRFVALPLDRPYEGHGIFVAVIMKWSWSIWRNWSVSVRNKTRQDATLYHYSNDELGVLSTDTTGLRNH